MGISSVRRRYRRYYRDPTTDTRLPPKKKPPDRNPRTTGPNYARQISRLECRIKRRQVTKYDVFSRIDEGQQESKQERGPPPCLGTKTEHVLINATISTSPSEQRHSSRRSSGTSPCPSSNFIPTFFSPSPKAPSCIYYFYPISLLVSTT